MTRTLLVTVDSLRKDHYRHMSRTVDYLGTGHEHAYATFPSTLGSFPAIVGGEYAVTSGLPAGTSVVPHLPGYRVGITTNHLLSPGYGYDDGFDDFESPRAGGEGLRERLSAAIDMGSTAYAVAAAGFNALQRLKATVVEPGRTFRPGDDVVAAFLDYVDGDGAAARGGRGDDAEGEADEDWFGWLHFMEPHHPYEPEDGPVSRVRGQNLTRRALSGRVDDEEADLLRELYRREVEELDAMLGPLWDALDDDVRVVFCADHGELLGEDGHWGHPGVLREELLRVPFATRNVAADPGDVVSLVDVPTVLRGESHGAGDLGREVAFASYGEQRAAMDESGLVTADDGGSGDRSLRTALDRFDVDSGLTRSDALDRDLEALGYK